MQHKSRVLLFFVFVWVNASAKTVWFTGGTLVDPTTRTMKRVEARLTDGRLHLESSGTKTKAGDQVFDVQGRYLIPGIYDMHVHSSFGNPAPGATRQMFTPVQAAQLVLQGGVTGFLDLFADEDAIFAARDEARKRGDAAEIFAAGPMFTCPNGHGTDLGYLTRTVSTPAEAETQVQALAKKHPDIVKIAYDHAGEQGPPKPVMSADTLRAIIQSAKKRKLKTVVHIGTWDDAREAVLAGADVITHLYETDIPDDLVKLMVQKKVAEIPTMAYQTEALHFLENRGLLNAPLLSALVAAEVLDAYRQFNAN